MILFPLQLPSNITQSLSNFDLLASVHIEFKITWSLKHQNDGASQAKTTHFLGWG
jgi:hypothetical protein